MSTQGMIEEMERKASKAVNQVFENRSGQF